MPLIMPIEELNSDLVVMSSELYDRFARINRIDQAIYESEQELANGGEAIDADVVFAELEKTESKKLF